MGRKVGLIAFAGALSTSVAVLAAPAHAPAGERRLQSNQPGDAYVLKLIRRYRAETWQWQRLMRRPLTHSASSAKRVRHPAYRRWVLRLWVKRVRQVRRLAAKPPRRKAWLCIQRYEAAWNDPHAPYYGGLQMDLSFQRRYGLDLMRRKGTADNWTPLEQMWVAERAYRDGRGFYPWPNTARACGLI
jgi:hypothetical protein